MYISFSSFSESLWDEASLWERASREKCGHLVTDLNFCLKSFIKPFCFSTEATYEDYDHLVENSAYIVAYTDLSTRMRIFSDARKGKMKRFDLKVVNYRFVLDKWWSSF